MLLGADPDVSIAPLAELSQLLYFWMRMLNIVLILRNVVSADLISIACIGVNLPLWEVRWGRTYEHHNQV